MKSALDYASEVLDTITPELTDDDRFEAFLVLLNEGNEEMAVLGYAGIIPIPEHLTD